MITIDDVALPIFTAAHAAAVDSRIDQARALPWVYPSWPGPGLAGLGVNRYGPPEPVHVNRFRWYTGASRWGHGHFLADKAAVDAIHDAAFGADGTQYNPLPLKITAPTDAGDEELLSVAQVWLLPPTPLFRVTKGETTSVRGMYLLTVVDQRYWWWQQAAPDFAISDATTWDGLFTAIASALNVTITTAVVNSAYLRPSRALNCSYEALPPLLDAACTSVGHVLTVDFDGTIKTQIFTQALKVWQTEQAITWQTAHYRTVRGGGPRFTDGY